MAIEQEWWKDKLAEDIYTNLKLKELSLLPYYGHSPQLWLRRHLVDWLSIIVGDLGICAAAQHLAVYLLDHFMDSVEVERCYLHLLALCCLLVAVKFEDHSEHVPQYSKLSSYLPVLNHTGGQIKYTAKQYLVTELDLLKLVDFRLCVPTVAHFLPYFLQVAVDEDDLRDGLPITSKSLVETYLAKHAMYFQEVCLQDHVFREYSPSLIAASCVAAARICLHLTPTWPKQLELMTDLYLEQLLPCLHILLGKHHQDSLNSGISSSYTVDQSMNCLPLNTNYPMYVPSTDLSSNLVPSAHCVSVMPKPVTGYQPHYTGDLNSAYVFNTGFTSLGATHMCRGIRGS